jgi:hypothetical protein
MPGQKDAAIDNADVINTKMTGNLVKKTLQIQLSTPAIWLQKSEKVQSHNAHRWEGVYYNGIIGGRGPIGTTPLPAVTEEYPRFICIN